MKKKIFMVASLFLICGAIYAQKEKKANIKFDKTTYNMGTFAAEDAIIECPFIYTNIGDAPLYIHQIFTSCGCTEKRFPTAPLMPGESDTIFITYNGKTKSPGNIRKSVTVHCNAPKEMYKLYIKGEMLPAKVKETEKPFTPEE